MIKKIDKYFISISFIRIVAILLITNTHMNNVYPSENIAVGGFIGDILFFVVSGFGLYKNNKENNFIQWYLNRLLRIYPLVWICTIIYTVLGVYNLNLESFFFQYFYPTNYHFVGSIIILYIFYYFFLIYKKYSLKKVFVVTFIVAMISYLCVFDKSYYHIDAVEEWFVKFIYFEGMIFGAYVKANIDDLIRNLQKLKKILLLALPISSIFYFFSKIGFSNGIFPLRLQIINQFTIFILVINISLLIISYDGTFEKKLKKIKKYIVNLSMLSLEIYLVQKPIISLFESILFPVNFLIIMVIVFLSAYTLNIINLFICEFFKRIIHAKN